MRRNSLNYVFLVIFVCAAWTGMAFSAYVAEEGEAAIGHVHGAVVRTKESAGGDIAPVARDNARLLLNVMH